MELECSKKLLCLSQRQLRAVGRVCVQITCNPLHHPPLSRVQQESSVEKGCNIKSQSIIPAVFTVFSMIKHCGYHLFNHEIYCGCYSKVATNHGQHLLKSALFHTLSLTINLNFFQWEIHKKAHNVLVRFSLAQLSICGFSLANKVISLSLCFCFPWKHRHALEPPRLPFVSSHYWWCKLSHWRSSVVPWLLFILSCNLLWLLFKGGH